MDYKEFASMFLGNGTSRPQSAAQSQRSYQPSSSSRQAPTRGSQPDPVELVKLFRDKIRSRGARGIIGL